MAAARVVLAGVHGHGRAHLANLRRLHGRGLIRLVGVCDPVPAGPDQLAGFDRPVQAADLAALLGRVDTDITVVATPIHSHADLALTALAAGSQVLLEKPPTPTAAEFRTLLAAVRARGLACQVGFQSLGSAAVTEVRALVDAGRIGRVRGIGMAGCWTRDAAYFARTPWAGHRLLGDTTVTDGVLTNPFAHGVATALRLEGSEEAGTLDRIETELFHAYPIESDDTSCLRLRTRRGTVITVAASVCGPRQFEPYILVHGDAGRIVLWYTLDRVELWTAAGERVVSEHQRVDLLENLVAHLRHGAELLVPLHRTGAFTDVVDAIGRAPDPRPIPVAAQLVSEVDGRVRRRVVVGIERLVRRSAERLALFSELAVSWAATGAATSHTPLPRRTP
jgi:predicted dehydrogenase